MLGLKEMPPQQQTTSQAQAVPPAPVQPPTPKRSSKKLVIALVVLVILIAGVGSGLIFLPKYQGTQYVAKVKPAALALKNSTAEVNQTISQMYATITGNQNPTAPGGDLRVSGLLIHPEIALLSPSSNVLGVSTNPGLIESAVENIARQTKGTVSSLSEIHKKVAAASTSPADLIDSQFRQLISESQTAKDKTGQAQTDLDSALTSIHNQPFLLSGDVKQKIAQDSSLENDVKPYIDESSKISGYYEVTSNTIIGINTDITSFKTALNSAQASFSQITPSASPSAIQTALQQSQIYLNQAKKSSDDIKNLSQTLKNIPAQNLPTGSDKYQEHNIQVLETVTTYFDAESKIFQSFIDASNALLAKINTNSVTQNDLTDYQNTLATGGQNATLADTQFISDLQALVGEEKNLTLDFWQNSQIFSKSQKAQQSLTTLIDNLDSVK